MKLKDLATDKKSSWFEYPYADGFKVHIAVMARKTSIKLYEKNTKTVNKFNPLTGSYEEQKELDVDAYTKDYSKSVILGWTGLKLRHLDTMGVFDIGDHDPEMELPFSDEDAVDLLQNSKQFDEWVAKVTENLVNFRTKQKEPAVSGSGSVAGVTGEKSK